MQFKICIPYDLSLLGSIEMSPATFRLDIQNIDLKNVPAINDPHFMKLPLYIFFFICIAQCNLFLSSDYKVQTFQTI